MIRKRVLAITIFFGAFLFSTMLVAVSKVLTHRQASFAEAAWDGNIALMKVLLAAGADVNEPACKYERCLVPIVAAAWTGQNDAIQLLLDRGANVNASMKRGQTALMIASYHGHLETVRLLLSEGADVNASFDGITALKWAAENNHTEIVELLRQTGAKN